MADQEIPVSQASSVRPSERQDGDKKISIIMAHPDDAELICFGTILYFVNQGYEANVVIVTDGGSGSSSGRPENKVATGEIRRQESIAAFSTAAINTSFLGLPDGYQSVNIELISTIEKYLKTFKPQIVITHYAASNPAEHQDHIAVGCATVNAVSRAPSVTTLLQAQPLAAGMIPFVPNYFVNITPYQKAKMEAISKHTTQLANHSYMTERFHQCRGAVNAFSAGRDRFGAQELYEAFFASLIVMT